MVLAIIFLFVGFLFLGISNSSITDIQNYKCNGTDKDLKLFDDS